MPTGNQAQKTEYFTPCGVTLGELSMTDTQHLLSLLIAKCAACTSIKNLNLQADFDGNKAGLSADCDGVPSFERELVEI